MNIQKDNEMYMRIAHIAASAAMPHASRWAASS